MSLVNVFSFRASRWSIGLVLVAMVSTARSEIVWLSGSRPSGVAIYAEVNHSTNFDGPSPEIVCTPGYVSTVGACAEALGGPPQFNETDSAELPMTLPDGGQGLLRAFVRQDLATVSDRLLMRGRVETTRVPATTMARGISATEGRISFEVRDLPVAYTMRSRITSTYGARAVISLDGGSDNQSFSTQSDITHVPVNLEKAGVLQVGVHSFDWSMIVDHLLDAGGEYELEVTFREFDCTAAADVDEDGLCDLWETHGMRLPNGAFVPRELIFDIDGDLELSAWEAPSTGTKDLYIEVDSMSRAPNDAEEASESFALSPTALESVRVVFAYNRIRMIIDTTENTLPHEPLVELRMDESSPFHVIKERHFGSAAARAHADWPDIKLARARVFRYAIALDHVLSGGTQPLGAAQQSKNDFAIAVGRMRALAQDPRTQLIIAGSTFSNFDVEAQQAVNFMHELGHTLGLEHGGDESRHCKPNYVSIMNYAYSFVASLSSGSMTDHLGRIVTVPLDFSHEDLADLDETRLSERTTLSSFNNGRGEDNWLTNRWLIFANAPTTEQLQNQFSPVCRLDPPPENEPGAPMRARQAFETRMSCDPRVRFAPAAAPIDWDQDGVSGDQGRERVERDVDAIDLPQIECPADASSLMTSFDDWRHIATNLAVNE
jgi:hypothetical protein